MLDKWRTLFGVVLVFFISTILAVILGYNSFKKSYPGTRGSIHLGGISKSVTIIRDKISVPHIFAENLSDLYFAAGYVTAQDRLWQMELLRREAAGRLAEIFGPDMLDKDRLMRTIGFMRIAYKLVKNISPYSLRLLTAYTAGINACLNNNRGRLPVEFNILAFEPEPWEIHHCLACLRLLNWKWTNAWHVDLLYSILLAKFDQALVQELWMAYPNKAVATELPTTNYSHFARQFLDFYQRLNHFSVLPDLHIGSNCWIVSGKYTQSGKPILATDQHLPLTLPPAWYQIHLSAESAGINVTGLSLPGIPGVIMGHNQSVAWANASAFVDDVDFQIVDSLLSSLSTSDAQPQDVAIIKERIDVRGSEKQDLTLRLYNDNPIISDLIPASKNSATVVMHWLGYEMTDELAGIGKINRAGSIDTLIAGLEDVKRPGQVVIFADTSDNIGYKLAAQVPIRKHGNGLLPLPGWEMSQNWHEFIPFEELPRQINPIDSMIIAANNSIVPSPYPYFISSYWEPTYRAERIKQLLSTTRKLVPADFQSFQNDILSLQARDFIPYFLQIMAQSHYNRNEVREQAYQLLKGWDFVESYSSITACIFNVIFNTFLKLTFNDEMGTELFNQFLQLHGIPIHAMNNVCQNPNSKWFDNIETKTVVESRDDIILQAINQGIEELERKFGSNIGEWRWDKLHRLTFKHFFDIRKLSKSTFSIGPIPGMGGNFTINNGKFDLNRPYEQIAGATARLVIDLSDLNSSWTCITPGQSGHLFNEYFDNQLLSWQTGMLSKIYLKQDLLEQQDLRTLVLVPESDE